MALSPKERDRIVEEETLRFGTRRDLHAQAPCARRGRGRTWLWCAAFFLLGYALHGVCGRLCSGSSCPYAGMEAPGHHCMLGSGIAPDQGGAAAGQGGAKP